LRPGPGQHPRHLHDHHGRHAAAGDHRPATPAARQTDPQVNRMQNDALIVLDIGKTNAKLALIDANGRVLAEQRRPNVVLDDGPYPHLDTDGIWQWMLEVCRGFAQLAEVSAIVPVTHGATAALVDGDGLVLPVLDYEAQ